MKKRILTILLAVLLLLGASSVTMAAETDSVTAIDGAVTIQAITTAEEGTPVLIFILPAIFDDGEDVTADRVAAVKTGTNLSALNADHIGLATVGAGGVVNYSCQMNDSLPTGLCQVVITYLGSEEGCYSVGTFEHVGRNDVNALLEDLNDSSAETCGPVIDADINGEFDTDGETRLTPKEILRKSSADTAYYESLTNKAAFHQVYYLKKGNVDFTTATMISAFNEAAAWIRLRNEANTLDVLETYNGEETGKYWNLPIGVASDFANLGDEKAAVLAAVKAGNYTDKDVLAADFRTEVLMGMFRNLDTREDLAMLIAETHTDAEGEPVPNPYGADFAGVRAILSAAALDEFELITVQNSVLDGNELCTTMTEIEALFTNSLPVEVEDDDDDDYRGGGGVSMGASGRTPVISTDSELHPTNPEYVPASFPFRDVAGDHWAKDYIQALYEKGAVNGVSKDTFNASGNIYRQDFVKILVGALEMIVTDSQSVFSDVPEDAYYTKFVMTAYENGLIQGVGDGFGVSTNITRQDAAVILSRVLEKNGVAPGGEAVSFADGAQVAAYAQAAVAKVSAAGIFGGDEQGNFNPAAHLSRAEACAILCRLAEMLGEV